MRDEACAILKMVPVNWKEMNMTEDQLDVAVELVRRRGIRGVTNEFLQEIQTEGDVGVGSLNPTFDLEFPAPEFEDSGGQEYPYRATCLRPGDDRFGQGEASTPGIASFLAFAEALVVYDLRSTEDDSGDEDQ
jgi:hypothetical protein